MTIQARKYPEMYIVRMSYVNCRRRLIIACRGFLLCLVSFSAVYRRLSSLSARLVLPTKILITWLPSQLRSVITLWPEPNYTAWWQRHVVCEQLAQSCYLTINRPLDRKSDDHIRKPYFTTQSDAPLQFSYFIVVSQSPLVCWWHPAVHIIPTRPVQRKHLSVTNCC